MSLLLITVGIFALLLFVTTVLSIITDPERVDKEEEVAVERRWRRAHR